jgi:hypothetical protein
MAFEELERKTKRRRVPSWIVWLSLAVLLPIFGGLLWSAFAPLTLGPYEFQTGFQNRPYERVTPQGLGHWTPPPAMRSQREYHRYSVRTGDWILELTWTRQIPDPPSGDPGPQQAVLHEFAQAFNAGDFDAQYRLFCDERPGKIPLLPKAELERVLREMDPPFPKGMQLGERYAGFWFAPRWHGDTGGTNLPILTQRDGRPASGKNPDLFPVGTTKTAEGLRIRPYFTYWAYYDQHYGRAAAELFHERYREAARRAGLPWPLKTGAPPGRTRGRKPAAPGSASTGTNG